MLRNIWLRRNGFIFENKFDSPKQIVQNALKHMEAYQSTIKLDTKDLAMIGKPLIVVKKWNRSQVLQLKANWDATVHSTSNITDFGGVIRDSKGKVIASYYSSFTPAM